MSKALLHIGLGKCLSTSLQNVWNQSTNYDYLNIRTITKKVEDLLETNLTNFDQFINQVQHLSFALPQQAPDRHLVFSCEGATYSFQNRLALADYIPLKQKTLARILSAHAKTVLLVIRNPKDWIISSHSQNIKQGGVISLEDYVKNHPMIILNNLNLANIIAFYEEFGCNVIILPLEISKKSEEDFWLEYEARLNLPRPTPSQFPSDTIGANLTKKNTINLHRKLNSILQTLENLATKGEYPNKKAALDALSYARKWGTRRALTVADENDIQTLGRLADVLISDSNTDIKCDAEFIDVLHQNFLKPLKKRGYFPYEDLLKTYQQSIEAMRA